MSASDAPSPSATPPPAPGASSLAALDADRWGALLPHLRAALGSVDGADATPLVRRLAATPTGRLAGGRRRRELCELVAAGGALWHELHARVSALEPIPEALAWVVAGDLEAGDISNGGSHARQLPQDRTDEQRARRRARAAREQRDEARRRAEGAEARATAAEAELAAVRAAHARDREELAAARAALDEATAERRRAVDRERRRRSAELETLRVELADLRRAEEDRQNERRRREAARDQAAREKREVERRERSKAVERGATRIVPGRPSRLPDDVHPGTREAVELLLHPGRLVLVDGYNVTLSHRGDLDLEQQRAWLIAQLAALAGRRRVRPVAVFDGERAGTARPASGAREVDVRFTAAGITADDELVLDVEATDEPVLVVTDDRELTARLAAIGADVVATAPFVWALR